MLRNLNIDLIYQPTIDAPPAEVGNLRQRAAGGDKVTCDSWRDTWIKNFKLAKERFGNLGEKSFGQLQGINRHKPCIVIGSGPSLKQSLEALKENKTKKYPVMSISALHNFGYLEDNDCHADYYLSLDSGGIVIDDVSESRNHDAGFYWEKTKGKKLIAYVSSDPKLFDLWQGEIYLFNCLIPDDHIRKEYLNTENFTHYISAGGNAGGACMYTAKAIFGSSEIIYVGMDFCFDYDNTFHTYKTHYDNVGEIVLVHDVYGNMRKTWPSYLSFKFFLDDVAMKIPGKWTNCSEGILGAYTGGNIKHFEYKPLKDALVPYWMSEEVWWDVFDAQGSKLSREKIDLEDFFKSTTANDKHMVLF